MLILLALLAGPLGLRTQGPLRELFLDVTIADARPLEHLELDVRWSMANTWNELMVLQRGEVLGTQVLDEQADSLQFRFAFPWPRVKKVFTALEWKITEHWGGWSDRPIEGWHSLIGAFNYQRALYPRDQVKMLYSDDGGTAFAISSPTLAPGDITARTQVSLLEAPVALAARFDFKLPVASLAKAAGSGGFDAGAALLVSYPFSDWGTFHGMIAVSRFSHLDATTALQPRAWHYSFEGSLEMRFGENTFLVEDRVLSPLLEAGWTRAESGVGGDDAFLSSGYYADFRSHNQISFGYRRGRFTFWLSEDFTPGSNPHSVVPFLWVSNAPDVVIGVAFTQPFR